MIERLLLFRPLVAKVIVNVTIKSDLRVFRWRYLRADIVKYCERHVALRPGKIRKKYISNKSFTLRLSYFDQIPLFLFPWLKDQVDCHFQQYEFVKESSVFYNPLIYLFIYKKKCIYLIYLSISWFYLFSMKCI